MRKIIGSIDIGSDEIKLIIAEIFNREVNVLCALSEKTVGFKAGVITNEENFIKTVKMLINNASEKLGFKIKKLIANIPTSSNDFLISEATNTITSEDGIVTSNDILRILQTVAYNKVKINDELLAVIPISFRVDEAEEASPIGKKGSNLACKAVLVSAAKSEIYEMLHVLEKCGLEIVDVTATGLVDYYNFKNEKYDTQTGIMVNIGDTKTSLSVFSKGIYINNEVLNVGGALITQDIGYIYKLNKSEAKLVKEELALASIRRANPKETVRLINSEKNELVINQYELTEIVASRLLEILKKVKNSINHLTKKEISYIIITGGLTELKDFPLALASVFGETAHLGNINTVGIRNNKYSVALGMIRYFNEKLKLRHREYSTISELDADAMCNVDSRVLIASDSILGKVFGYFFDN